MPYYACPFSSTVLPNHCTTSRTRLAAFQILGLVALTLSACNSRPTLLTLSIHGNNQDVQTLNVQVNLDKETGVTQLCPLNAPCHLNLRQTSGSEQLTVCVKAVRSDGCYHRGQAQMGLLGQRDLQLDVDLAATPVCKISLTQSEGGNGTLSPALDAGQGPCLDPDPPGTWAEFPVGSIVRLSVTPDSLSYFIGWGQDCQGTGDCMLSVDSPKKIAMKIGPRICKGPGWCWDTPLPQGNTLRKVFGTSPSNVWAVGEIGTILHYGGSTGSTAGWRASQVPDHIKSLAAIWGSGADAVWAVGENLTILRLSSDGQSWNAETPPTINPPPGTGGPSGSHPINLTAIWGSSSSDVWAVGSQGTVLHRTASGWSLLSQLDNADLSAIWGAAANDFWLASRQGWLYHCDGSQCGKVIPPAPVGLWSLWGSANNDVWTGGDGTLLHYDGSSWQPVAGISDSATTILSIFGTAANDLWFVGQKSAQGVWLHCTGDCVHGGSVSSDALIGTPLIDLWGSDANNIWAVGSRGSMMRYDGQSWEPFAGNTIAPGVITSAWGSSTSNLAWAVADLGSSTQNPLYSDSTQWQSSQSGSAAGAISGPMNTIFGFNDQEIFGGGPGGQLVHWSGDRSKNDQRASGVSYPEVGTINAIWGSDANHLFATSANGFILSFDGKTDWTYAPLPPPKPGQHAVGSAIWGSGPADVYVAGEVPGMTTTGRDGEIWHFDGNQWSLSLSASMTVYPLLGISGTGSGQVWATGEFGTLLSLPAAGATWIDQSGSLASKMEWLTKTGTEVQRPNLRDIWSSPTGDVWIVTSQGSIYYLKGGDLTQLTSQWFTLNGLLGIGRIGPQELLAWGSQVILRYRTSTSTP